MTIILLWQAGPFYYVSCKEDGGDIDADESENILCLELLFEWLYCISLLSSGT